MRIHICVCIHTYTHTNTQAQMHPHACTWRILVACVDVVQIRSSCGRKRTEPAHPNISKVAGYQLNDIYRSVYLDVRVCVCVKMCVHAHIHVCIYMYLYIYISKVARCRFNETMVYHARHRHCTKPEGRGEEHTRTHTHTLFMQNN